MFLRYEVKSRDLTRHLQILYLWFHYHSKSSPKIDAKSRENAYEINKFMDLSNLMK